MKKSLIILCLALFSANAYCQQYKVKKEATWVKSIKQLEKAKKDKAESRKGELRSTLVGGSKNTTKGSTNTGSSVKKQTNSSNTGRASNSAAKYMCPQCNGTGVYSLMPGDVAAPYLNCAGCNGRKMVTAQEYRQIIQNMAEFNRAIQPSRPSGRTALKGKCPSCGGSGRCTSCAGQGVRLYERTYTSGPDGIMKCSACNQSGKCSTCNGTGRGI